MIRVPQVRVIDEDGGQLGVMPTFEALRLAQERGFDLVEVAPLASPPVTKLLDFGQYKYDLTKREKEAKRRQRSVEFKEIRLRPKIGVGDFETKVNRAIEFLEAGDRIKVSVQFRGRELTHPEIGRNLLIKFTEQIKDHGAVERAPLLEGKSMHLTVASTHKPKGEAAAAATAAPAGPDAAVASAAPVVAPAAAPAEAPAPVPAVALVVAAPARVVEAQIEAPALAPAIEDAPAGAGEAVQSDVAPAAVAAPAASPRVAKAPRASVKTAAAPDREAAPAKPRATRAKPAASVAAESGSETETGPAAAPAAPKRRTATKKEASADGSAVSKE